MGNTKDEVCKILADHKAELREQFHVESLAVFGSVCTGTDRPGSDVDILVRYSETPGMFAFLELKRYLETIVGRKVDLVTEGALKRQLYQAIMREAIRVA